MILGGEYDRWWGGECQAEINVRAESGNQVSAYSKDPASIKRFSQGDALAQIASE